jgi:hypothetical protein
MPNYMLLLHDNTAAFANVSPEQMQQVIEKYMAWGEKLRAAGILREGQKLTDEPGRVMRRKDGYMIEAASYDQAVEYARDCPQFEYGGTVEIRQIDQL